jgi:integrase/recombinase XerD
MTNRRTRVKRAAPTTARTFTEWLPYWENELGARGVRPRTVHNQREGLKRLAKFFGNVNAATVTDDDFIGWRDALTARGLMASTVNSYLVSVGTFYNWLVAEGVIAESPLFFVPFVPEGEPAPPPCIAPADLDAMTKAAAKSGPGRSAFELVRNPAMLSLLRDTGLRASECAGLLVEHFDLGGRQVYVHGDIAKGGRARTVTFGFQTARMLNRYLLARESHRFAFLPQLFVGRFGAASYATVRQLVRQAAGLPLTARARAAERVARATGENTARVARPHLLRHTWAHDMKSQGAELETLMALGGWRTTTMPMRYGRAEQQARAIDAYKRMGSPVDRQIARGAAR